MKQPTGLFFRIEKVFIRIDFDSILFLEACANYTRIVTLKKTYMVLASLTQVEKELPAGDFCRIHRSFIIRLDAVTTFNYLSVSLGGGEEVPLGYSYRKVLVDRLPVFFNNPRLKNRFMTLRPADMLPAGEINN